MKKILLLLALFLTFSCSTNDTIEVVEDSATFAKGKPTKCDDYVAPPTDKIFPIWQSTEKQSAEDVVLYGLNNITFRWYPKNGKWKPFLSMNVLPWYTLYGTNDQGEIEVIRLMDLTYRFTITGVDNDFVHEGCTTPDFGVTSYYGIRDLPDGVYNVEFTDFGITKQFIKPSF